MIDSVILTFKKLLGHGRAWLTPKNFTNGIYELFASPFETLKNFFLSIKLSHFPVDYTNENNIVNGEELFDVGDIENLTLNERAANVQSRWSEFGGSQTYKQIENILRKRGFDLTVIENIPQNFNPKYAKILGNGWLIMDGEECDPIQYRNGKHTFILQMNEFITNEQAKYLLETLAKNKPAHNAVYFIPRCLRKKEIHHILTKREMQQYKKSQYCYVRVKGKIV